MRLPITSIPPILGSLQKATGLPNSSAGLLTTIPLLTFALVSPILAWIGKKFGNELTILLFFCLLVVGSLFRISTSIAMVMVGTFLIALGIDSANVLLPAVIKDRLQFKPMLGVSAYTTSMSLAAALGTGFAGVIVAGSSLRIAMIILTIIGIISVLGWLPMIHKTNRTKFQVASSTSHKRSIWSSKISWLISLFFGLQSLIYYSLLTWLPSIFVSNGFSSVQAGTFVTIVQIGAFPCAFVVPFLADRKHGDAILVWILGLGFTLGTICFGINGLNVWFVSLASLVVGISSGIAFNLAIVYFAQKSINAEETAEISGMAQTVGYLLAAVGPVVFGYLQSFFHSWGPVLIISIILSICLLIVGIFLNKQKSVF